MSIFGTGKRETAEERQKRRKRLKALLGLYLDDLLFVTGSVCIVAAAALAFGCAAAFGVAGVCLIVAAVTVARAARR
jgi:hypothetical protein